VGPTASGTPSDSNRLLPTGIVGGILMRHFDLLLMRHPHLRSIDYQRLVQRVKTDPPAHWDEFVEACAPIVLTAALRMARPVGNVKALAEQATVQVFQMLAENNYALIRAYVGYGKFPSELVRLTQLVPALAEPRQGREFPALSGEMAIEDDDAPVPALDACYVELLEKEGDRFVTAVRRVVQVLHPAGHAGTRGWNPGSPGPGPPTRSRRGLGLGTRLRAASCIGAPRSVPGFLRRLARVR